MKKVLTAALFLFAMAAFAQHAPDTVVVALAKTSRIVFTIQDKSDLEQLKQYDFQALFNDILAKLENNQSVVVVIDSVKNNTVATTDIPEKSDTWPSEDSQDYRDRDDYRYRDNDDSDYHKSYRIVRHRRTRHHFNVDLGLNNYLEDGKFPDEEGAQYAIRPLGSWYIGLNSIRQITFSKNFLLEWGLGVSWYNFKFQNNSTLIVKDNDKISFEEDLRDVSFIKSKLGITYINTSVVPMFTAGGRMYGKKWKNYHSTFRIGAGPYIGYRVASSSKQVFKEDGDRERDRNRDNFYLTNLRYGIRAQIGVRNADFFFNYDLNELFASGKGPKLNAFSFGVTF